MPVPCPATRSRGRAAALLIVAGLAAACGVITDGVLRTDPGRLGSCSIGVGRDATIHGSPTDPVLAWAIDTGSRQRVELIWPMGYTARFNPGLLVLDRDGKIVAHEGDLIIGSCLSRPEDGDAIQVDPADIRGPGWQPGDG